MIPETILNPQHPSKHEDRRMRIGVSVTLSVLTRKKDM